MKMGDTNDPMGYSSIPLREQHTVRFILQAFKLKDQY